uniref:transposase n=1 Tax=Stappia albiluteola TaxID=2758565 RepID=UPI0022A72CB1|nr:transposase [Stappia albiluteola]
MLEMPVGGPRLMLADKGYDGDTIREALLPQGILPVIPPRSNHLAPAKCDDRAHKDRNRIERMFNRLKQLRRIATRYDKTARSFLGFLCLAAARLWLPSFVNWP